ncbi:Rieske (2Fe-2S) protein [Hyalangium versicolor]|uniref:Rieske (2Fe-2S) protein n=1 Tax=Hyalangium versicolor TaxID=2861190 RepID=UPI001CC9BFCC|nr:Rieske 2Fe-2S domain-containing protein [Hyalangium versicolor]
MERQPAGEYIPVAHLSDLDARGRTVVQVEGDRVAIVRIEGELFAFQDRCPHREGSLSEGDLEGYVMHCPLHAWPFDVRTGLCPVIRGARIRTYALRVVGEEIQVAPFSGRVSPP